MPLNINNNDFNEIKNNIILDFKRKYPEYNGDESSSLTMVIDVVSYLQQYYKNIVDYYFNEQFIDSQIEEQNQNSLLELIGYKRQYGTPNNGNILLSLKPELIQIILNKIATYTDITLKIKETDDSGNILYLNNKINSKQQFTLYKDYILTLNYNRLLSNSNIGLSSNDVQIIQLNDKKTQEIIFDNNQLYQVFEIDINNDEYLLPESLQLFNGDEFQSEEIVVKENLYELYTEIVINNKKGQLLKYNYNTNKWNLIISNFFNQDLLEFNKNLTISFITTYGEKGNIPQYSIEITNDIIDFIYIDFIDIQGNKQSLSLQTFLDFNTSSNIQDYLTLNNINSLESGQGIEDIEIQKLNQINKINTNQRQITKDDYIKSSLLFLNKIEPFTLPNINVKQKLNWISNISYVYFILRDLDNNIIFKNDRIEQDIQLLQNYLSKIVVIGSDVVVEYGQILPISIKGTIYYKDLEFKNKNPKSELYKILLNIQSNFKLGETITKQEIQKLLSINSFINIEDFNFYIYNDINNLNTFQIVDEINLQENQILYFQNIQETLNNLTLKQI